jgi:hypothetical protein
MQFRTHDVTYRRYAGLFFSQYVLISLIISWYTWKCIHLSRYWKISSAMSVKLISVLLQQGNMGNGYFETYYFASHSFFVVKRKYGSYLGRITSV